MWLAAVVLFGVVTSAQAAELTGRQIVDEVDARHEAPYEYEEQVMVLRDSAKRKEVRQLKRFKRKTDEGARYLLGFTEPSGVSGTSLLTWQFDDKDDDQWLYLPAMGSKMKRIAKGGKRNYFMGTDYTYEDLASEPNSKFEYERLADQALDGQDHYVVKSIPIDEELKRESGYESRVLYVRKDIFFITQVDYYNKRGKFIKKQIYKKLEQIDGKMWRANFSYIKNADLDHETAVQVKSRSFSEEKVDAKLFTSRYILSGRHIK